MVGMGVWERSQYNKEMLYEIGAFVRNYITSNVDSEFARTCTFVSIARAVWYQDRKVANGVFRNTALGREHLRFVDDKILLAKRRLTPVPHPRGTVVRARV